MCSGMWQLPAVRVVVDDDVAGLEELLAELLERPAHGVRDRAHHRRRVVLLGDQVALAVEQDGREVEALVEDRRVRRLHHHERHLGGDVREARCAGRAGRRCRARASSSSRGRRSSGRARRSGGRRSRSPGKTSVVESGSSITAGPSSSAPGARLARRWIGQSTGAVGVEPDLARRPARPARCASATSGTGGSGRSAVTRRLISSTASPGRREAVLALVLAVEPRRAAPASAVVEVAVRERDLELVVLAGVAEIGRCGGRSASSASTFRRSSATVVVAQPPLGRRERSSRSHRVRVRVRASARGRPAPA